MDVGDCVGMDVGLDVKAWKRKFTVDDPAQIVPWGDAWAATVTLKCNTAPPNKLIVKDLLTELDSPAARGFGDTCDAMLVAVMPRTDVTSADVVPVSLTRKKKVEGNFVAVGRGGEAVVEAACDRGSRRH